MISDVSQGLEKVLTPQRLQQVKKGARGAEGQATMLEAVARNGAQNENSRIGR